MNETNLYYQNAALDRASELRSDSKWLDQALASKSTQIILHNKGFNLFKKQDDSIELLTLGSNELNPQDLKRAVFLGMQQDIPLFSIDYSESLSDSVPTGDGEFLEFRQVAFELPHEHASILAYANGLHHWHNTHRFCPKCGSNSEITEAGHVRKCINTSCQQLLYPRLNPAIIVLVERLTDSGKKKCLLGRHVRNIGNRFSTLAGFIEPGESLEDAVRREIKEESGIHVNSMQYLASQAWPPEALMLGFHAQTNQAEFQPQAGEIAELRWFTAEELQNEVEQGLIQISRKDSIARFLIDSWVQANL